MHKLTFKKVHEDRHGPIVNVMTDNGHCIGRISKWNGLFVAMNSGGMNMPCLTRKEAAASLLEHFEFEHGNV